MCLSTVLLTSQNNRQEVMKDVARVETHDDGFWLINLFGEKTFIKGTLQSIDLVDEHVVVFNENA